MQESNAASRGGLAKKLVIALTIMAAGRAMTIPFIGRAGDGGAGDPPDAWLMPLIGDAAIGLAAVAVAALLWWRPSPTSWLIAIVWSAIGAFDAIAAFIVDTTSPWPDFFMLQLFGRPMFFAAAAMHILIIYLLFRPAAQQEYLLQRPPSATGRAGVARQLSWAGTTGNERQPGR